MNRKIMMFYSKLTVLLCLLSGVAGASADQLSKRGLVFDSSNGGSHTRTLVGAEAELPASAINGKGRGANSKSNIMLNRPSGVKQHSTQKRIRLSADERRTLRRQIQEAEGDLYTQQK
jgi:hypothetical protein